jgi:glycosyltransferase involved in cell wall biosynthesis
MIVKNESEIVVDTLTKLLKKINFDYWVISDTGSTDNTIELITNFFKERNIKGEMFEDKWEDFGTNRTKALEHAYNKTDYLLIFDADDEIYGNFKLPDKYDFDAYHFTFGSDSFSYQRRLLVNNRKKWKFVGVLHEAIDCLEPSTCFDLIGDYFSNNQIGEYFDNHYILIKLQ